MKGEGGREGLPVALVARPTSGGTRCSDPMQSNTRSNKCRLLKSPSEPPCGQGNAISFVQREPAEK